MLGFQRGYSPIPTNDSRWVGRTPSSVERPADVPTTDEVSKEEASWRMKHHALWIQESMAQVTALQQYAVVSVVLSGFAFSGLNGLDHQQVQEQMTHDILLFDLPINVGTLLIWGHVLSTASCIAFGLYATLIFALCAIYGATAISKGDRDAYANFMAATESSRKYSFRGFQLALVAISASIMFILCSKLPSVVALIASSIGCLVFCFAFSQASHVMSSAHQFVFAYTETDRDNDTEDEDGIKTW
eukprot:TRINITY_DN29211_c0_g1_i1.p1 TRINITY_DN29211_c0_g1~~TRINITY_DN29211_c0_g1_i1.p1  ORF type:complete len:245 (-),score=16.53 TRINITY_DN29211_c0_g1_i1:170-904(-)